MIYKIFDQDVIVQIVVSRIVVSRTVAKKSCRELSCRELSESLLARDSFADVDRWIKAQSFTPNIQPYPTP